MEVVEEPGGKDGREVMWPPEDRVTLLPGSMPAQKYQHLVSLSSHCVIKYHS